MKYVYIYFENFTKKTVQSKWLHTKNEDVARNYVAVQLFNKK